MNLFASIAGLALADLRHEWRMTLCLVLTVAAIATPLLLFFGLKNGAVSLLRQRLLNDPVNLELLPKVDRGLRPDWFATWRADSRVAFIVPRTRKLAAQASLRAENGAAWKNADMVPSAPGDRLLETFGIMAPEPDACVLSAPVAEALRVQAGSRLVLRISRINSRTSGERQTRAERTFTVSGVLPSRATLQSSIYLPLEQVEAMEDFRDGRAVPEFGWPGTDPVAYPVFPSVLVLVPEPLDAERKALLLQNTGFASLLQREPKETAIPWLPSEYVVYELQSVGEPAGQDHLNALRNRLRGYNAAIVPLGKALRAESAAPERPFALRVESAAPLGAVLPEPFLPEEFTEKDWTEEANAPAVLLVNPKMISAPEQPETPVRLLSGTNNEANALLMPMRLVAHEKVPEGVALAPAGLVGVLNLLASRPLALGGASGKTILLGRRGYPGFRMYAADLDQVAPLAKALEQEGIQVETRADRIEWVRLLDRSLSLLFWIIASASLAGGLACLLSSLYANVERKRRELAVLRLLGVQGSPLAVFPLVESLAVTFAGMGLGLALFHLLGVLINHLSAELVDAGETLCRLAAGQQLTALGLGLGMALLAGLAASRRLNGIEPAESLRDE